MQTVFLVLIFLFGNFAHALPASEWQSVLAEFKSIYQPIAEDQGKKFGIKIEEETTPMAAAYFDGKTFLIKITSGFFDQAKLDQNTLRLVLCHEAGHFFGGSPRKHVPLEWDGPIADDGLSYISSEGQADYYATRVCFPKLKHTNNDSDSEPVPELVRDSCINAWAGDMQKVQTCERASQASKNFLKLAYDFDIDFDTPDLSVTPVLIQDSYPGRQCRLDTLFRGALNQSRPSCWFK